MQKFLVKQGAAVGAPETPVVAIAALVLLFGVLWFRKKGN